MKILDDVQLDYKDVLILPKKSFVNSRNDVDLNVTMNFKYSNRTYTGIPLCVSNMFGTGTISMAKAIEKHDSNISVMLHKFYSPEQYIEYFSNHGSKHVWYSLGLCENDWNKFSLVEKTLCEKFGTNDYIEKVLLDVANGYTVKFLDFVKKFRDTYPNKIIMAGNVCTFEGVENLVNAGADCIREGIGGGANCLTRSKAGVGRSMISSNIECAKTANAIGAIICADGGCTCPGDIAKAFATSGNPIGFVCVGGMFAGTSESEQKISENGTIVHCGMSSFEVQKITEGKIKNYRASEGKAVNIPFRGDVKPIIDDIMGSLRSTCTYTNSKNLSELPNNTTLIKVTMQTNDIFGKPS